MALKTRSHAACCFGGVKGADAAWWVGEIMVLARGMCRRAGSDVDMPSTGPGWVGGGRRVLLPLGAWLVFPSLGVVALKGDL